MQLRLHRPLAPSPNPLPISPSREGRPPSRTFGERGRRGAQRRWGSRFRLRAYQPREQKRETVSSGRCVTLAAGLTNFLSTLAEAALEGRLPRGFSVKRLPMLWSEQWRAVDCESRFRFEPNLVDPRLFNSFRTLYWRGSCFGPAASIVQPGKRNFAGRDWPVRLRADYGRTAGIRFADRPAAH
jgi:hypothetical protein